MATKKELLEKLDKIDDEELAHMLALVAYRESQEELDQLIQSEEYTPPDEIQMRTFQEKFHKDSQRALHRSKSRIIRWACGIAAAAVFVFAVPISADNVTIFELVAQVFTNYSDISTLDGYTFEKPAEWDCEYYPTWIPKSFIFDQILSSESSQAIIFRSNNNSFFIFVYTSDWFSYYSSVEEKNFTEHPLTINGNIFNYYASNDGRRKILHLKLEAGSIILDGNLTEKQLKKIAESIFC